jgi:hypothetical protein
MRNYAQWFRRGFEHGVMCCRGPPGLDTSTDEHTDEMVSPLCSRPPPGLEIESDVDKECPLAETFSDAAEKKLTVPPDQVNIGELREKTTPSPSATAAAALVSTTQEDDDKPDLMNVDSVQYQFVHCDDVSVPSSRATVSDFRQPVLKCVDSLKLQEEFTKQEDEKAIVSADAADTSGEGAKAGRHTKQVEEILDDAAESADKEGKKKKRRRKKSSTQTIDIDSDELRAEGAIPSVTPAVSTPSSSTPTATRVSEAGSTASSAPESPLKVGDDVVIWGLQSARVLNGLYGRIVSLAEGTSRLGVKVEGVDGPKAVKAGNLRRISGGGRLGESGSVTKEQLQSFAAEYTKTADLAESNCLDFMATLFTCFGTNLTPMMVTQATDFAIKALMARARREQERGGEDWRLVADSRLLKDMLSGAELSSKGLDHDVEDILRRTGVSSSTNEYAPGSSQGGVSR